MGYLRKNSFLIFSDPDAPAEDETLERQKISKASSAPRYVPHRTDGNTVRFRDDGYLGINLESDGTTWVEATRSFELDGSTHPSLWVKVVDGWSEDGNWGGYLQITCVTDKDKYIDSSSGWAKPVDSKGDKVTFYDMGNYYEIWQGGRETGRPLTVQDRCLRFTKGAIPGKWNIQDSTWD